MICSISGRVALAFSPMQDTSIGTCRQPWMAWPNFRISVSTISRQRSWASRSVLGRKTWPTAIRSFGREAPPRSITSAKKSCGISTWIPGAVAGLAVGIDRAAVPDRLQRIDAGLHHVAPGAAVQRRDQADAAGIVFVLRAVGVAQQGKVAFQSATWSIVIPPYSAATANAAPCM